MNVERSERLRHTASIALTTLVILAGAVIAGSVTARLVAPTIHGRYFLWVTGRSLGIAAYVTLLALVLVGTWIRHPWRFRFSFLHGESRLRVHAALGVATIVLVAGHLVSLAADRYAGVGWQGAVIPGMSRYRTIPVAIGVVSFLAILLLAASATCAGRKGTRHWLALHRGAAITFVAVWLHGVLAGTDARMLRLFYAVTGLAFIALVATRMVVCRIDADIEAFEQRAGTNAPAREVPHRVAMKEPARGTSVLGSRVGTNK